MIFKKTLLLLSFFITLSTSTVAQVLPDPLLDIENTLKSADSVAVLPVELVGVRPDTVTIVIDSVVPIQKKDAVIYPPIVRDWRRLKWGSAMYIGSTIIAFGVLWTMPESATNWDRAEIKRKGFIWKWEENVKAGPVWDKDNWVLNWITHPYSGGIYYMTARSSGFTVLESFGYSAIMSTFFWEYGIESLAEVPSIQDLIITPVIGSVVGEGFFYAKKSIMRHDKKILKSKILGYTTLFLMDPFNTLLDGFGYKENVKTQMNFAPVGVNQFSKAPIWGVQFTARF